MKLSEHQEKLERELDAFDLAYPGVLSAMAQAESALTTKGKLVTFHTLLLFAGITIPERELDALMKLAEEILKQKEVGNGVD